jgi:hypothetical protein
MAPTLAEMLADPSGVEVLSIEAAVNLRREALRLAADLDAVVARGLSTGTPKAVLAPVLGVKEAAVMLGTSTDSLYRKHKSLRLGFICPLDGKLKFLPSELAAYVARQGRR